MQKIVVLFAKIMIACVAGMFYHGVDTLGIPVGR